MNRFESITKPLMWFMALLLVALAAGCGGGSESGNTAQSSGKAINAYSLAGVAGTINETTKTISVAIPYGTNVTALVATYTTTGAGVKVGAGAQTSGSTANNFAAPVTYVVTAADSTTATYTVTVAVLSSAAKAITAYSLAGVAGAINETAKTVAVTVPYGTNVTDLAAAFTTTGASVSINTTVQTSGQLPRNDFSNPLVYTVTAIDTTTTTYTVTVTVAANFAKSITAYSLDGIAGTINETAKTISVPMPNGKNITAMVATFTSTGSGPVTVGGVAQVSGSTGTPNNFSNPVAYTVTAANSTTATYTVNVTVAQNSDKTISAYSLAGVAGTMNGTAISVIMPSGTDVTTLVASFTTTGANVKIGTLTQTSGTTVNNFASQVTYIVTAADTSTATYTVTVTLAAGPVVCTGTVAACVDLGTAANYAIFGKTGVTNVPTSIVTGNLASAAAATSITGFVKTVDAGGTFSTDPQVTGKIYAFDYVAPTPSDMTAASNDMVTAYGLAAGKLGGAACPGAVTPGDFSGLTLTAGVYKCTQNVVMPTNLILNGTATDVWVFQFSGTLTQANNMQVQLTGGALRQNVFWQVAGAVQIGTGALMQGVILSATNIDVLTGATVKGRLLAQTAVNLQAATVTQP